MYEKAFTPTLSFYLWAFIYSLLFFASFFSFLAALPSPSDPPTSTARTAFTAHAIRKNYEINAHFRKCYESHLEQIIPDYNQLWPINRIFRLFPLFSSRFLAFSLVFPFLFAFRFS